MARDQSYKRQKLSGGQLHRTQEICLFPPTKYEESKATLKNFPLSIVNGVTAEGGLYSLTFKSINCATYVENNELMKKVFKVNKLDLPKISDVNLQKLKENLNQNDNEKTTIKDNTTSTLQSDLQSVLESGTGFEEFQKQLYETIGNEISFSSEDYKVVSNVKIPNLKVDQIDDVKNLDLTSYTQSKATTTALEEQPVAEIKDDVVQTLEISVEQQSATGINDEVEQVQELDKPTVQEGLVMDA